MILDQACRSLPILSSQRMRYCLDHQPLLLVPCAGALMQSRDLSGGRTAVQSGLQYLCEQVMIAIPLPCVIQWHQEQVRPFQLLEDDLAVRLGTGGWGLETRGVSV